MIPRTVLLSLLLAGSAASPAAAAGVRPSAIAGAWYPGDRASAIVDVHRLLRSAAAAPALRGKPVALVVPHAGWRFSGIAAAAAFRNLHPGDFARVVIVAPSHHVAFEGFATDGASAYRTPLGDVPVCSDALRQIADGTLVREVSGSSDDEHAVEIELPFLQETLGSFCLLPIEAGRTSAEQESALAARLAALHDGKTLFLFSSDFTHYGPSFGYTPFGVSALAAREKIREQLDGRAIELLTRIDAPGFRAFLKETGDTICGRAGLGVLLDLLPRVAPKAGAVLLATYASSDLAGFADDSSVSYVALAYTPDRRAAGKPLGAPPSPAAVRTDAPELPAPTGERLLRLARAALRTELAGAKDLERELSALPAEPEYERLQGVFVTLNRTDPREIRSEGRLRGCIGQVLPAYPLYQAVVEAAVDAALHDQRFEPVQAAELERLEVDVTVLSPPRPIESWRGIRLGTHGIVLEKQGRRALFLPQVPGEQGWTIEQTLSALSQKAGLPSDAWREGTSFSVFTGQVFRERPETRR